MATTKHGYRYECDGDTIEIVLPSGYAFESRHFRDLRISWRMRTKFDFCDGREQRLICTIGDIESEHEVANKAGDYISSLLFEPTGQVSRIVNAPAAATPDGDAITMELELSRYVYLINLRCDEFSRAGELTRFVGDRASIGRFSVHMHNDGTWHIGAVVTTTGRRDIVACLIASSDPRFMRAKAAADQLTPMP